MDVFTNADNDCEKSNLLSDLLPILMRVSKVLNYGYGATQTKLDFNSVILNAFPVGSIISMDNLTQN